ncbi:MAG: LuxR family transcriptional regulator [Gammaproteobacteria bacterium]
MVVKPYWDEIQALQQAQTAEDIHHICSRLALDAGFEHFVYGARVPTSLVKPALIFISGFPEEWWSRYREAEYIAVDPIVNHCAGANTPLPWGGAPPAKSQEMPGKALQMMSEAWDVGLRSGLGIPVHSSQGEFAVISFSSSRGGVSMLRDIETHMAGMYLMSGFLHEAVMRVSEARALSAPDNMLTMRERECLLWASEGKTTWEISQILRISERTVIFHLQNVTHKLGVSSRQHAIARAISQGLITPQF